MPRDHPAAVQAAARMAPQHIVVNGSYSKSPEIFNDSRYFDKQSHFELERCFAQDLVPCPWSQVKTLTFQVAKLLRVLGWTLPTTKCT